MAKNIEEFLKQAAARRQKGQQQQQQPQQHAQQQRPAPRRSQPEIIEIVDEVEVIDPLRDQSVGTHAMSHIDTSEIAQHAERLGGRVSMASKKIESDIHQKFDHDVGHLDADSIADIGEVSAASTTAYESQEVTDRAKEMIDLFRTPKSIRQAVLLNEILTRPNWD